MTQLQLRRVYSMRRITVDDSEVLCWADVIAYATQLEIGATDTPEGDAAAIIAIDYAERLFARDDGLGMRAWPSLTYQADELPWTPLVSSGMCVIVNTPGGRVAKGSDAFISLIKAETDTALNSWTNWASQRNPMFAALASLPNSVVEPTPTDPLDVEYDGVKLRELVEMDQDSQRYDVKPMLHPFDYDRVITPIQRAAISAHWSAQLRAKVAASAERERARVLVDLQEIE